MNLPDLSSYVVDDISFLWGYGGATAFWLFSFLIISIIKSAFKFARWYITRKNLRKSSADIVNYVDSVINREDGLKVLLTAIDDEILQRQVNRYFELSSESEDDKQ